MRNTQAQKQLIFAFIFAMALGLTATQAFAQTKTASKTELHQLSVASGKDWVAINPSGTKMAVVQTAAKMGQSLKIYQLDANMRPQKVLFENKGAVQLISEVCWVGDVLFYTTIEGFSSSKQYWDMIMQSRGANEGASFLKRIQLRTWPSKVRQRQGFKTLRFSPPGKFSMLRGANNTLLAFDPLEKVKGAEDSKSGSSRQKRFLDIYQVPQGTLLKSLTLPLPSTGYPWASGQGNLIPLFVSHNGKHLVCVVSSYYPWRSASRYRVPFIIAIDLQSGSIHAITPDSGHNGLTLSGDPRYFERGNPMAVDGGKQVVCRLNTIEAGHNLMFRFGYFDIDGKKDKEVLVFRKDLKQAGVPAGSLITWTPDGKHILVEGKDLWVYDLIHKTGVKIATDIWVMDVVQWVDNTHLLVRFVDMDKKDIPQGYMQGRYMQSHKEWAILTVPEKRAK